MTLLSKYHVNISPLSKVPVVHLPESAGEVFNNLPVQEDAYTGLVARVLAAVTDFKVPDLHGEVFVVDPQQWADRQKVPTLAYLPLKDLLVAKGCRFVTLTPAQYEQAWEMIGVDEQFWALWSLEDQVAHLKEILDKLLPGVQLATPYWLPIEGIPTLPAPPHWKGNFTYEGCVEFLQALTAAHARQWPQEREFGFDGRLLRFGKVAIEVTETGITFGAGRYVRKGILALKFGGLSRSDVLPANEFTLLIYGLTYGVALLRRGAIQELYRFLERFLPLDSEEQAMAARDEDRLLFLQERYTPIYVTGDPPLQVVGGKILVGAEPDKFHVATMADDESDTANKRVDVVVPTGQYDLLLLREYGLVKHITAGSRSYVTARLNAILFRDVPAEHRRDFVLKALAAVYGVEPTPQAVVAAVRKQHGEALKGLETDEDALAFIERQGVIPFTTKTAKPKRALAEFALCAELINGKPRWFTRPDQPGPADGVELAAIIAPLAYAPGVAILLNTEGVDTRYVVGHSHTTSLAGTFVNVANPELFGPAKYGRITQVEAGTVPAKDRVLQYKLELPLAEIQGLWVDAKDPVLAFRDQDGVVRYVHAGHSGYLRSVEWSTQMVGNHPVLDVNVRVNRVYSIQDGMKARGAEIKALLHRGLNDDVAPAHFKANVIITSDTLKGTDVLSGLLPVMVQTMWNSPIEECRAAVRAASRLSGHPAAEERFVYSELVAATDGYKGLVEVFEKYYLHRDVWFKHVALAAETGWHALREYVRAKAAAGNGFERLEQIDLPPAAAGLTRVEIYRHTDTGNVLVFGEREGLLEVHQRCPYVYAGTEETGPVLVNWKVELSSVQQAVTTTATMASVIRYVAEQGDLEFAKALAADGEVHYNRFAVLMAGYRNRPLVMNGRKVRILTAEQFRFWAAFILGRHYGLLPKAPLAAARALKALGADQLTALLTEAVAKATVEGGLAQLLADGLGPRGIALKAIKGEDVVTFWVHLGTLFGRHTEEEGLGTLAGRLLAALTDILVKGQALQASINGVHGALGRLLASNKPQKRLVTGRIGLNSKSIALPGLDPTKLYIKYSREPGSFFQQFADIVGTAKLDGRKVLLSRAPMNAAAVLYIEVVRRGHPLWERMNDYQVVTDLLPIYIDAGDCDGDGRTVIDAAECRLEPAGVAEVLNIISERTGLTPAEEENYLVDHLLGFKNFRKIKRSFTLLGGAVCLSDEAEWVSDYARLIHKAHVNQVELVGVAYRVAEYGDRLIELYGDHPQPPLHAQPRWALPLYNIYETLLGGLSKEMYVLVQYWIRAALKGGIVEESLLADNGKQLRLLMRAAGLNERLYDALASLVEVIRKATQTAFKARRERALLDTMLKGEGWRAAAAHVHYILAKGEAFFPTPDKVPVEWQLLQKLAKHPAFTASTSIVVEQLKRVAALAPLFDKTNEAVAVTYRSRRPRVEVEVETVGAGGLTPETMTADQRRVYEAFRTGRNVIYSGAAGTGKTTLARYLIALARADKGNHVLVASTTGNGAKVLGCGATTVHKLFGLGPEGACLPSGEVRPAGFKHRVADNLVADSRVRNRLYKPGKRTVVFIDEVFRLSPQSLHIVLDVARKVCNGNVQFVLFGDPAQGAPVPAHEDDPVQFTWEAPVWRLRNSKGEVVKEIQREAVDFTDFQLVTLEQVVRQGSDSDYARMLNRLRLGDTSDEVVNFFTARTLGTTAEVPDETSTYLYATNREVAEHNARVVAKFVERGAKAVTYRAVFNGRVVDDNWAERYPEIAREVEPISPLLLLVEGMRVMIRQECRSLDNEELHNGEEGILLQLNDDHVVVQLDGRPRPVRVGRVPIHLPLQYDGTDHPDTYEQLPLCLSAAMTVAKSQGMTKVAQYGPDGRLLPSSLLVVRLYTEDGRPSVTGSGDLYVALSRTQVIEQLIIDHVGPRGSVFKRCIVADPKVTAFLEKGAGIERVTILGHERRIRVVSQEPTLYTVEVLDDPGLNATIRLRYGCVIATSATGAELPIDDPVVAAGVRLIKAQLTPPTFKWLESTEFNGAVYHAYAIVGVANRLLLVSGGTVQVVDTAQLKVLARFPLNHYLWADHLPQDGPPRSPQPPQPPQSPQSSQPPQFKWVETTKVNGETYHAYAIVGVTDRLVLVGGGTVQIVDTVQRKVLERVPLNEYPWADRLQPTPPTPAAPVAPLPPVVHVKLHEYDVNVDRGTPWGNPFTHVSHAKGIHSPSLRTAEDAVKTYERWLLHNDLSAFKLSVEQRQQLDARRRWILDNIHQLRGKRLACWCVQQPTSPLQQPRTCHAMTLALLAAGLLQIEE